ncbi:hypothetical protein Tamer19_42230 [Cupriavidus sp. TA19]|uniref:hypothetical protein n=1 Tax=unclassified Cupriavidus TaxID=2640874 RepID=UPI0018F20F4A|nr:MULTISPECIES: hypothetical protein [unclassified Cupriavidus]BDB30452.1 hypothetical protein CTP10_R78690 [Cupriavidus sp. P-10]GLC94815.1 hypothetical protein Tamer19_42230 [Cupriavidus sp. TA19]
MERSSVAGALRALATDSNGRSETARLRDVLEEVEAALSAGVKRQAILDALNAQGFRMSLKGFESALYRIRRQRGKAARVSCAGQLSTSPPMPPQTQTTLINEAPVASAATSDTATEAVRDALTNQQSREEKFSRYSSSTTLSKRLGHKKES